MQPIAAKTKYADPATKSCDLLTSGTGRWLYGAGRTNTQILLPVPRPETSSLSYRKGMREDRAHSACGEAPCRDREQFFVVREEEPTHRQSISYGVRRTKR
jgi:hypothetical protein